VHEDSIYLPKIRKFFLEKMEPIYGDQCASLKKIEEGNDRKTFILLESAKEIGILVFKKALQEEFSAYKVCSSLQIKTLALFDPEKDSRKGYGTHLLTIASQEAFKQKATSISVTVSTGRPESVVFFQKKGFSVATVFQNFYQKGWDEVLLFFEQPEILLRNLTKKKESLMGVE